MMRRRLASPAALILPILLLLRLGVVNWSVSFLCKKITSHKKNSPTFLCNTNKSGHVFREFFFALAAAPNPCFLSVG